MNTYEVKELVEGKGPITVTLVPGYGDGYTDAQLDLIDGHVSDIVERIRELNRAAVVTISPMNTSTPVRVAEFTMLSLGQSSDIILLVTPSHVKVDKWRGHRDRIGCYIGN